MKEKIIGVAVVCLAVLAVGRFASAGRVVDWSSKGGHTQNKDNLKDRMYLSTPGDRITFGVTAAGAEDYEWQVNKKVCKEAGGEHHGPD